MKNLLNNKIANRYAGALFKAAKESNRLEEVYKELDEFIGFCKNQVCLKEFLSQNFIGKKERMDVINLLGKELSLSQEFINFINLLIENERAVYLFKIFNEFSRLKDNNNGILAVNVVSAVKLSSDEGRKIKDMIEKFTNKTVILNEEVSTQIIGGYIIDIDGKLYDSSIKTQLGNLYNYLKRGAYIYGD